MASLQAYESHHYRYYRLVESFRGPDGKPRIRVLAHLGRAEDILRLYQEQAVRVKVSSVSAGAVTALYHLAQELDLTGKINAALPGTEKEQKPQRRDGLTVGESLVAGIIARVCAPRSKRAFAAWAQTTYLPQLMSFSAEALTSQHFWDQMHAVPVSAIATIEQAVVRQVVEIEQLTIQALAYDTTNFYTYIATTNTRPKLPQRGHNKQKRHDLRQLGLALVVDQNTQLPLAHQLYEGARADMKTFVAFLEPARKRLRALLPQPEQWTFVFDAGAASKDNLTSFADSPDHYVTALRPSDHKALLAEVAPELKEVELSTGAVVRAWRGRRVLGGQLREAVVVFSPRLYAGQMRGFEQDLRRCWEKLEQEIGLHPEGPREKVKKKLAQICHRQYVRGVMKYEVHPSLAGGNEVRLWCDRQEYQRLTQQYFGLRVLASDRQEWTAAQIIEAYRGQAKAEAAFRDLKNPGMLATRPQFHWTDQKLRVHALMCVLGYLLARLLWWRVRRAVGFAGSPRSLLNELGQIRCCHMVEQKQEAGRRRVHEQLEEINSELGNLGKAAKALPRFR